MTRSISALKLNQVLWRHWLKKTVVTDGTPRQATACASMGREYREAGEQGQPQGLKEVRRMLNERQKVRVYVNQCQRKKKNLQIMYEESKDWRQLRGHLCKSPHFDALCVILRCQPAWELQTQELRTTENPHVSRAQLLPLRLLPAGWSQSWKTQNSKSKRTGKHGLKCWTADFASMGLLASFYWHMDHKAKKDTA